MPPKIKEMKATIARAGLAVADLLERADVEARYVDALARLAEADRLRGAADAPPPPSKKPRAGADEPPPAPEPATDAALDAAFPGADWSRLTNVNCPWSMPSAQADGWWFSKKLEKTDALNIDFLSDVWKLEPPARQALLLGVARRAPNITSLGTESPGEGPHGYQLLSEFRDLGDVLCSALPAALPNLRHLSITASRRADLLGAVAAWPSLVALSVKDAAWTYYSYKDDGDVDSRAVFAGLARHEGLRFVSLPSYYTDAAVADVATLLAACPNIECIDASSLVSDDPDDFDMLRRACLGSRLRCVIISSGFLATGAPWWLDIEDHLYENMVDCDATMNILGDLRKQVDEFMDFANN